MVCKTSLLVASRLLTGRQQTGQTEWSKVGKYTGTTEKYLTEDGEKEAAALGKSFFGKGKLIDPSTLARIFVSPRVRAQQTLEFLMPLADRQNAIVCEDVREWEHGDYEGMTSQEIRSLRAEKGLDKDKEWSIWTGGCPGGESVEDVTARVKRMISTILEIQEPSFHEDKPANILIVGHGTFLRCFAKIWGGVPIDSPLYISLGTGTVAVMSFEGNVNKRTIVIGHQGHVE
ncbi:hypothetical protein F53441_1091 [Fusarium austroafricanum]|uniref:Phosphoglycerate mutase n=1 Tax=Fusarium austroafricanum TaxID=2364996 RepID=A0A8H4KSY9_9HYPO|nr:hypothetical protein F53441_1091 [Fusarium austroafricanum]